MQKLHRYISIRYTISVIEVLSSIKATDILGIMARRDDNYLIEETNLKMFKLTKNIETKPAMRFANWVA